VFHCPAERLPPTVLARHFLLLSFLSVPNLLLIFTCKAVIYFSRKQYNYLLIRSNPFTAAPVCSRRRHKVLALRSRATGRIADRPCSRPSSTISRASILASRRAVYCLQLAIGLPITDSSCRVPSFRSELPSSCFLKQLELLQIASKED
jgi:hypothetical protein